MSHFRGREFTARIYEFLIQGKPEDATAACEDLLGVDPESGEALAGLGAVRVLCGEYEAAVGFFARAVRLHPGVASYWGNLGAAYLCLGDMQRAARLLARARRLDGGFAREYWRACRCRAADLYRKGLWKRAAGQLLEAIRADPLNADSWSDLGSMYGGTGKIRAGARCFRQAIILDPANTVFRSNLAVIQNYRSDLSPEQICDSHRELFSPFSQLPPAHQNSPDPDRLLRVGYFSADFRFRPPAFFLPSLLAHHDRSRFVIFCYSNTQYEDVYTEKMRNSSDHWRDIQQADDDQLATLVRQDGIDILVDRTGHFERGRPGLFARVPAPVQVSLPGYPATTGIPGMHYRITDGYADPPGMTEHLHTETLARLPQCFACYSPPDASPGVTPLPAISAGHVTFGCFQKREKISVRMLDIWARVLAAVPGSRLVFHHLFSGIHAVPDEFRLAIGRFFWKRGIDPARIAWVGRLPHREHLESLAQVDIALDTYPYNGMTTTCESLWMGVPVVTLAGRAHVSRVGLSYLTNGGMADWVAHTDEEYLSIAVSRAKDLEGLAKTRRGLRASMLASPLTDPRAYSRAVEAAYRTMWHSWCR